MPKLDPDRHITRANYLRTNGEPAASGYMVRFIRRGKRYQNYFGDSAHGGAKKALIAARKHRDEIEPTIRTYTPAELAKRLSAKNTSGTAGVRWAERVITKNKKKYTFHFAVASWSVAGQRKSKAFSAGKYGEDKAWELATKARKAGLKEAVKAAQG